MFLASSWQVLGQFVARSCRYSGEVPKGSKSELQAGKEVARKRYRKARESHAKQRGNRKGSKDSQRDPTGIRIEADSEPKEPYLSLIHI